MQKARSESGLLNLHQGREEKERGVLQQTPVKILYNYLC